MHDEPHSGEEGCGSLDCPHCKVHCCDISEKRRTIIVVLGGDRAARRRDRWVSHALRKIHQVRENPRIARQDAWVELKCFSCGKSFRYHARTGESRIK